MKALLGLRRWLLQWAQGSQLQANWAWWTGGLLLILAAGLHLGLTTPWQAQASERLTQHAAAVGTADLESRRDVAATPKTTAVADLPPENLSPKRAAALLALAQRQGLATTLVQEQTDSSGQLQVSMQGKARYPALRLLVGGALTADPALILERLSLRRAESTTPELDFDLLWTFSQRKPQTASDTPDTPDTRVAQRSSP